MFYVCEVRRSWEKRVHEHVCGCEHTHVHACLHVDIHVWLENLSISLPELQHKRNSHWPEATGVSGHTGLTHMVFLLACVLETMLWEAVPSGVMDLISPAVEPVISGHFWNPPGDGPS